MNSSNVDVDNDAGGSPSTDNNAVASQDKVTQHVQKLVHARQCQDANCQLASCPKVKRIMAHVRSCRHRTANGGCPVCKQFILLCTAHAKHCQEIKCPVPCCISIKQKLRQRQLQQRRQMAVVHGGAVPSIASTSQTLYQPTLDPASTVGSITTASMVPSVALLPQQPSTDQPVAVSVLSQEIEENASSVDITPGLIAVQQQHLLTLNEPVQIETNVLSGNAAGRKQAAAVGGARDAATVKEMKGAVVEDPISDDDMFADKSVSPPRLTKDSDKFLLEQNKKVRLPLFIEHTSL